MAQYSPTMVATIAAASGNPRDLVGTRSLREKSGLYLQVLDRSRDDMKDELSTDGDPIA